MFSIQKMTKDGRPLLIREAAGCDASTVLEYIDLICRETDYLTFGPGEFRLTQEEEAAYLEKCREAGHCLYLLAFLEGALVGALTFEAGTRPRLRHAGEFGISVLKVAWGIGIGSALMDSLLEWSRNGDRIAKIDLRVRADNHRAIALYERKGFVVEGKLKNEVFLNGVYYDHLCMGLDLKR